MPRSGGLAVGSGIASGANAFVQSFMQAKQLKHQEKLQKNAFIIQTLTRQLEDDNLPYYERAKILDSIPNLLGAKMDRPLSEMMGLHQFNEQTVEDPNQPAEKGVAGNQDSTLVDRNAENANIPGMATSVNQKGTEGTYDVPAGTTEQGNLTPAIIKKKLILETQQARDNNDIEKQAKLLEINYRLQKQYLGKGGYTKELPATYDADGNYTIRFMNPDGDVITRNLGKVDSEAIRKAKISADAPKGKLGQLQQAQQIVTEYETNNTSHTVADYNAAKALLDDFEKTGQVKDAQIRAINQNVTGNPAKPITPAQRADDFRADKQNQIKLQEDVDNTLANATQTSDLVQNLSKQKQTAYDNYARLQKQLDDLDSTSDEYKALAPKVKAAEAHYNKLETQFGAANSKDQQAKAKYESAKNRLNTFGGSNNYNNPNVDLMIEHYKPNIDQFRKDNPNTTISDEDIVKYLRGKGVIK